MPISEWDDCDRSVGTHERATPACGFSSPPPDYIMKPQHNVYRSMLFILGKCRALLIPGIVASFRCLSQSRTHEVSDANGRAFGPLGHRSLSDRGVHNAVASRKKMPGPISLELQAMRRHDISGCFAAEIRNLAGHLAAMMWMQ